MTDGVVSGETPRSYPAPGTVYLCGHAAMGLATCEHAVAAMPQGADKIRAAAAYAALRREMGSPVDPALLPEALRSVAEQEPL